MKNQEVSESFLSCVSLRLIKEEEQERFDQLLETQHYLSKAPASEDATFAMSPK